MSDDQPPVQPPPPAYTPPPPAYSPPPPQPGYQAPPASEPTQPPPYPPTAPSPVSPSGAPPKKKMKPWVIALVVVGVLLCCCGTIGTGALLFLAPEDSVTTTGLSESEEEVLEDLPAVDEDDPRLQEWLDWNPEAGQMLASTPVEKQSLIDQGLAVVAPEFEFEDGVWYAGEYDSAADWYYADGFFVRAKHPSSDDISAAVEMWIQSDEMVAEAVDFDLEEDDILDYAGDRQLVYNPQWGYGFVLSGEEDIDLWVLLGEQWPDGVVTRMSGDLSSGYEVCITKWDQYAVDGDYAAVWATYYYDGGEWVLDSWEYAEGDAVEDGSV